MKKLTAVHFIIIILIVAACSTIRKTQAPVAITGTDSRDSASVPSIINKPESGVYTPGDEELNAIQVKYPEATLAQLEQGYYIYSQGACIGCHGAGNIYKWEEAQWKNIMDDMAPKAMLTNEQKNAVYNYVLAIKAIQTKDVK